MVVFDSSILLLVLDPKAKAPIDPSTGELLERAAERVDFLIGKLSQEREKIIIPTPVLSEVLVYAGTALEHYLDTLNSQAAFRIASFDQKAALEVAIAMRDAITRGGHRIDAAKPDVTKTKIKFDRQIVGIAKAEDAHTIYSDDADVHSYAKHSGLKAYRTDELDLPPENPQQSLDFDGTR
jgi:predicted nucleic acid-binding protein